MAQDHPDVMVDCFICGRSFRFGPNRYDGAHIAMYDMTVCKSCIRGNQDGWSPTYEGKILAHLAEKNIPVPERNEKGWLPLRE